MIDYKELEYIKKCLKQAKHKKGDLQKVAKGYLEIKKTNIIFPQQQNFKENRTFSIGEIMGKEFKDKV